MTMSVAQYVPKPSLKSSLRYTMTMNTHVESASLPRKVSSLFSTCVSLFLGLMSHLLRIPPFFPYLPRFLSLSFLSDSFIYGADIGCTIQICCEFIRDISPVAFCRDNNLFIWTVYGVLLSECSAVILSHAIWQFIFKCSHCYMHYSNLDLQPRLSAAERRPRFPTLT